MYLKGDTTEELLWQSAIVTGPLWSLVALPLTHIGNNSYSIYWENTYGFDGILSATANPFSFYTAAIKDISLSDVSCTYHGRIFKVHIC